jgi:hypothetical protein
VLCALDREVDGHRQRRECGKQEHRRADSALAGEEEREQDDRAEVCNRTRRDHQLPERLVDLAGVLQDRDQDPERGRAQDHRNEQRRLHQPAGT